MTVRRRLRIAALGGGAMAATLTLTACVGGAGPVTSTSPSATADARSPLVAESSPTPTVPVETALWRTAGAPAALAGSLRVPWSIVPFADGTRIVSLRGGAVLEVVAEPMRYEPQIVQFLPAPADGVVLCSRSCLTIPENSSTSSRPLPSRSYRWRTLAAP